MKTNTVNIAFMKKIKLFLAVAALGGSLLAVASRDGLRKEADRKSVV